ncbi:MAG TPA: hypothetical protein VEM15_10860 [Thermodesulfobacteriota bacterium]|nr:hypothetical protein [Thermodesulfobacteriota bacterium]
MSLLKKKGRDKSGRYGQAGWGERYCDCLSFLSGSFRRWDRDQRDGWRMEIIDLVKLINKHLVN